ncbi:MAG TPA: DMT family transporter [Candidatus Acidoferrales bacterium]|nr:DMT family transporter [Candidatus Acidoferrales bacterium]
MSSQPTRGLALAAVAVTVLAWGCSNVVAKLISTSGIVVSFYRLWLAIPVLWLMPLLAPSLRRRLTRRWLRASLIGGGLFSLHQLLFFNSLKLTSVANVSIIASLQPALVLLVAGPMFGERATLRAVSWSVLALFGTIVVVLGSANAPHWSPFGDALAVFNLFAFTAYFLASKHLRTEVGALEYVIGMTTVSGVTILVIAVATGQALLSPRGSDWSFLLFLAMVPGTLGHVLTNWAHPHVSAFVISITLLGVPVFAAVGAALFVNEPLNAFHVVGGAIVLLAIAMIVLSTNPAASEELAESAAETSAP